MFNKKTFLFLIVTVFFLNGCGVTTNTNPNLPNVFSMNSEQAKRFGLPPVDFELQYGEIDEENSLLPDTSGANYADMVINDDNNEFMEELAIGYLDGTAGPVPEEFLISLIDQFKEQLKTGYSNVEFFATGKNKFLGEDKYIIQAKILITDESEGDPGDYLLLIVLNPNPNGGNGVTFILQANQANSEIKSFDDFDSLEKGKIGTILSTFKFINN